MADNETNKKKILVVEDDRDFATLMVSFLTARGHSAVQAHSCDDGLEKVRAIRPDLVTLDLRMPQKSGLHFYRRMKSWDNFRDVPVVVVTGIMRDDRDMENLVRAFLEIDHVPPPDAYVDKPFEGREFVEVVESVLARRTP